MDFQKVVDRIPVSIFIYQFKQGRLRVIYTNEYYRSLPFASERELMALDEEGLFKLVHPADQSAVRSFIQELLQRRAPGGIAYRSRYDERQDYRWYSLNARPVAQSDGSVLVYAAFTDITVTKEAEIRLLKSQQMYQLIAEQSRQVVFEYDMEHRRILYQLESDYTRFICEAQGMPPVVENVPESLVDMVDKPYRRIFMELFDRFNSSKPVSPLEYSTTIQGKTYWWRVTSAPVMDHEGHVLTTYCCAQDITDLKLEQQRYRKFFEGMDKIYPNNMGTLHLNLTRNTCVDARGLEAAMIQEGGDGTVDGCIREFSQLLTDEDTLVWFQREVTREGLIRKFNAGESTLSFPYSIRHVDGLFWRQGYVVMHQNPETMDIEALTYVVDTDRQRRGEMILEMMSDKGCDFVGYIDIAARIFVMYSGIWDAGRLEPGQRESYPDCIEMLKANCTSAEHGERLSEQAELPTILEYLQQEQEYDILYDFRAKDGGERKKQLAFQWLDAGRSEILVLQSDVTEVWAKEQRLHQYKAQLELMTEMNADFAACYHLNLTKDRCTNMIIQDEKYTGLSRLSAAGTASGLFAATADTVADPAVAAQMRSMFTPENLRQQFEQGQALVSIEYPCHSVQGGIRWILSQVHMVRNPEFSDIEAITYTTDIHEQRKNELVTRHISEQEFEYVAILYLDTEELELIRKKARINCLPAGRMLPWAVCRQAVHKTFCQEEEWEKYSRAMNPDLIRSRLTEMGGYTVSYLKTSEEQGRTCQQMRFSWLDKARHEVLIVQTDVTVSYEHEEKQIEAIQDALLAAERASSAKSDFVSRISHDIRTPIGAIANITDFALEDIHDSVKLRDDLRKIKVSNDFLLSLINDVLDISRIDSGRIELHPEPFFYEDFCLGIRNMFDPICQKRNIEFGISGEPEIKTLLLDRVRFNQIAMNLISNAVKYTSDGGRVWVSLGAEKRPDGRCDCVLQVNDTGIGMSPAFQEIMFEPFTQEEDHPLRDKSTLGSGLGLSLVKKLVDMMDGSIEVQSKMGQGSEIRMTIAVDAADTASYSETMQDTAGQESEQQLSGHVLLAEDNEINTEIEKRILEAFGIEVTHAVNGACAVRLFEQSVPGQYQAVLMDIQMPVMNGYEATSAIRALVRPDARSIPIIAMTADAFSAVMEHSKAVRMTDYLTKPLDVKVLRDTLAKYMQA